MSIAVLNMVILIVKDIIVDLQYPFLSVAQINSVKSQLETQFPESTFVFEEVALLIESVIPLVVSVSPILKESEVAVASCCGLKKK